MNVAHILKERAALCAKQPAIIDGDNQTLTFAELEMASIQAAARLREAGLKPGDTILVLVPMSAALYVSLVAIFRSGMVAMFLDPSAGARHIEECCAINPPKAFVGIPKAHCLRLISPALRRIPIHFTTGKSFLNTRSLLTLQKCKAVFPGTSIEPCSSDTPALIRFTSGSTGQPKAAVRNHGFLVEQKRVIQHSLRLEVGEIDLATMPIFVLANLASGITSLIPDVDLRAPGKIQPEPVVAQIHQYRPQRVSASPAFLERLAEYCAAKSESLDNFEKIFTGGAPVFPHLLEKFQRMSPGADVVAVYGSTEAEPIAQVSLREISKSDHAAMWRGRGLLAGRPDPAIQIRILREGKIVSINPASLSELEALTQPSGEPGQIIVSGPHVQPGYLNGIGDHETKLRIDGTNWHRTGDSGYVDWQGRLWLLGRSSARIEDGAGTLYPFQVECAAQGDPCVRRAALVLHRGARVLAVELEKKTNLDDLKSTLAWANIHQIRNVDRLPVDQRHNAKIDYPALQKMLS